MVDSLPRRQSRPFRPAPASVEDDAKVTPPSNDLMEHLETVFGANDFRQMAQLASASPQPADSALAILAEMAGRESVLRYMRQLIDAAHEVGRAG